jgi:hypothetical protein
MILGRSRGLCGALLPGRSCTQWSRQVTSSQSTAERPLETPTSTPKQTSSVGKGNLQVRFPLGLTTRPQCDDPDLIRDAEGWLLGTPPEFQPKFNMVTPHSSALPHVLPSLPALGLTLTLSVPPHPRGRSFEGKAARSLPCPGHLTASPALLLAPVDTGKAEDLDSIPEAESSLLPQRMLRSTSLGKVN